MIIMPKNDEMMFINDCYIKLVKMKFMKFSDEIP